MKPMDYWIKKLNLEPHPEGGYYKEMYRCSESVSRESLPERFTGPRSFSTAIYFLLPQTAFSAFHRINQDEIWHFYYGSPIILHVIAPDGTYTVKILGIDPEKNESPQVLVPAGCYFAAESPGDAGYTLSGCTVAPGFDFDDFIMPSFEDLSALFPEHSGIIKKFTR
jgi:hypothetical protein